MIEDLGKKAWILVGRLLAVGYNRAVDLTDALGKEAFAADLATSHHAALTGPSIESSISGAGTRQSHTAVERHDAASSASVAIHDSGELRAKEKKNTAARKASAGPPPRPRAGTFSMSQRREPLSISASHNLSERAAAVFSHGLRLRPKTLHRPNHTPGLQRKILRFPGKLDQLGFVLPWKVLLRGTVVAVVVP
ncbi:uncharacterized protein B0I36DRAFT_344677 [Microdochium trichocladiopsis]|uniref:Uncharacterized protein n=1 Tax=Microdochium trichocladiopsis TaxID=1682393 RepID=A0A9P8YL70_9PEZI|nr:uncharacterized protein B0I36DRAFT_344677 [Microdochium trichocladiopsis]KAH7041034.1 hypothetical protein B0I36DRAFT_344677 [Microdochium trichocladiopsis]